MKKLSQSCGRAFAATTFSKLQRKLRPAGDTRASREPGDSPGGERARKDRQVGSNEKGQSQGPEQKGESELSRSGLTGRARTQKGGTSRLSFVTAALSPLGRKGRIQIAE